MKLKTLTFFGIFMLILCFMSTSVLSLGITPPKIIYNFRPNLQDDISFHIYGSEEPFQVRLIKNGPLGEYMDLGPNNIVTVPSIGYDVNVSLLLPEDLEPGKYKNYIIVEKIAGGAGMVGGAEAVGYTLVVDVPYPGKYLEAKIDAENAQVNGTAEFKVLLDSLGKDIINEAKGIVQVIDPDEQVIAEVNTNTANGLWPGERERKIEARWKADGVLPGVYVAKAIIGYDDEARTAEGQDKFFVGELKIDILNITPREIKAGHVQEFQMDLINVWNVQLTGVKISISVFDDKDNMVDVLKGLVVDLSPMLKDTYKFYWGAEVDPGDYKMSIKLDYGDKITEELFDLEVVGEEKSNIGFVTGSLIVIIIVLVGVILFLYFRRRNSDDEEYS